MENNWKQLFENIFCKDFKVLEEEIELACSEKKIISLEERNRHPEISPWTNIIYYFH